MLFEGFDEETKRKYQDDDGMYFNACEWPLVQCDDHERVIDICAYSCEIGGSIQLCYVPPKVREINVSSPFNSS